MADCNKCIFPMLKGCPVYDSINNAACLTIYKDRETCSPDQCPTCRWVKFCKEKGINLNKDDKEN